VAGKQKTLYSFPDFFVLQSLADSGNRALLVSGDSRTSLTVRRGGTLRDLSWLGWSMAFDISPDDKSVLFLDGGTADQSPGVFIRALDGGDADRLGDGEPGSFSPDGRWVIGLTSPAAGPQQLLLFPVAGVGPRQITFSKATHSTPSFAGPRNILCVRSEGGRSEVWRVGIDGKDARSLGAPRCDGPVADPHGRSFLCRGGERNETLFVYPMEKGEGRRLYGLDRGEMFLYARWNRAGDRILAVAEDGRLLTLDSVSGSLLHEEIPPLDEKERRDSLLAATVNADGTVQAYSVTRQSAALYFFGGL
jgi:hypothetical protein